MPDPNLPLESFDPELQALLMEGTRRVLTFDAKKKGPPGSPQFTVEMNRFIKLRQRLHQLRLRINKRDPITGAQLYKATVIIYTEKSPKYGLMEIMPRDAQFSDLIEQANIGKVAELPPDFLEEGAEPPKAN